MRAELRWFVHMMEEGLQANDYKGGWSRMGAAELLTRLRQEADELARAVAGHDLRRIIAEATDVANFAMMIADNAARALPFEAEATATREAQIINVLVFEHRQSLIRLGVADDDIEIEARAVRAALTPPGMLR